MKKITIIGANSFLAKNLISYLEKSPEDYELFLYDRNEKLNLRNYCQINLGDINDVKKINFDVDSIFIFTGRTGGVQGFVEYKSFIEVNEIYFLNILRTYCETGSNARIIYPGTRLIYRESEALIKENSEVYPKSVYAVTKLACENYFRIYKDTYSLNYVILRICTPYGTLIDSKGNYGTFEIFWNQAINNKKITVFGDGCQRKTYTQMTDICLAFKKLIDVDHIRFESYNLGGQSLSINDVVEKIAKDTGAAIEHVDWPAIYKSADGGSVVFDSSRFDEEFHMTYCNIL